MGGNPKLHIVSQKLSLHCVSSNIISFGQMTEIWADKLRSVRWRVSLSIFSVDDSPVDACEKLHSLRKVYQQLCNQYINDKIVYNSTEVGEAIRVDVVRTFSSDEYFQRVQTRDMLTRLLYVWSVEHDDMSYRQGMNELLGLILIALRQDYQHTSQDMPKQIRELVNDAYMENDAYIIFTALMQITKPWYTPGSSLNTPTDKGTRSTRTKSAASPLYLKFNRIHNVLLKQCDPELYEYLQLADILPQLYLLRWVRVLFSREFTLEQSLLIWDEILARSPLNEYPPRQDDFVNFLCISMLVYIREELLSNDVNGAIMTLMRYPALETTAVIQLLQLATDIQSKGQDAVLMFIERQLQEAATLKTRRSRLLMIRRRKSKEKSKSLEHSTDISSSSFQFSIMGTTPKHQQQQQRQRRNSDSSNEPSLRRVSVDDMDAILMRPAKSEGWLIKRGGGTRLLGRHSLKKRWFALNNDTRELFYYKDMESREKDQPLKKPIEMHGRAVKILDRSRFFFCICPGKTKSQSRTYQLFAPSYREMIHWVNALQEAASTSVSSTTF